MNRAVKFVFTGGHHNAALEVLRRIKEMKPDASFLWLGHRHTSLKNKSDSVEYREVIAASIPFVDLKAGKFFHVYNIIHLLRIPYGFFQALYHLIKFRPNIIVSFGGYLAAPVVLAGWALGIPSVVQEQTSVAGIANRFAGRFATKVFITWAASEKYFPKGKTVLTGLPLRKAIFERNQEMFKFRDRLPTIYITGGKQGSHVINTAIAGRLADLLGVANVIHQTGANTETRDNEMLSQAREALPEKLRERYVIKDFVYENEIGSVFGVSDIIISRAGAHIIYEILACGKPSILVPIPWSSHNEQLSNAKIIESMGLGKVLEQKDLNADALFAAVSDMVKNIADYKKNAEKAKGEIVMDAADKIAEEIIKIVTNK
ncbi:MAG: hypothetical protein A3B23_00645 [Candidatus Colwellbacteria bacterium RIFCSPLOWO2_01_FULL_48_10]|uniref:UDP-N-acetylglucosamine--N-acetylmuramyl-(pentapeptide) pyrophosphoryl-undecaprenol N-acetylglucosamine transferase n=1 Tax=Candidatus Colwellbacteria bacterium RIFCSPLOWO2_01_FULL_48_10 TaxID=1797690 RepID=A0A1G1Z513_9BACT|nr:MAG: hypothetical protein A3B23_00645 [Candidatus Colwellbacteria bacterium RIFCSPLOWO2_01_FULL_48_10]